jgi:hypothetical protein
MKRLTLILLALGLVACSSAPKQEIIVPAPALREIFRGGAIQGLEDNSGHYMGRPGAYDLVPHSCSSIPYFGNNGKYVTTIVKCN